MAPDTPTFKGSKDANTGAEEKEPVFPLEQTSAFAFAVIVGLFAVVLATLDVPQAGAYASMVALASVSLGALLGFLFGVPPTSPSTELSANNENKTSGEVLKNTSLQEISSWLTKIIVGAGLVNLKQLAIWIGERGAEIGKDLSPGAARIFGSALIVYFFIVGFIAAYTYTRTKVASLFAASDRWLLDMLDRKITVARQETEKKVADQIADQEASTREIVERTTLESRMLIALYDPPPAGYELALELAQEIGAEALSAYGNYYVACALGQRLAHEQTSLDDKARRGLRERAYRALEKAVSDPTVKQLAERLFRGELGPNEHDLDAFRTDERFRALLAS